MSVSGPTREHEFEAEPGLPEPLPSGERLLWQGAPDARLMALRVFHVRKLAVYFLFLLVLRAIFVGSDEGVVAGIVAALWLAPVFVVALGLLVLMAHLSARAAMYTLTDKRVVMRLGIVLTVTFNLPLRHIESAGVHRSARGHGDLALTLPSGDKIAYLHLWPHARPWRVAKPEPMLRCIADVERVSALLTDAWRVANTPGVAPAIAHQLHPTPTPMAALTQTIATPLGIPNAGGVAGRVTAMVSSS
jgi:hypothetical protein